MNYDDLKQLDLGDYLVSEGISHSTTGKVHSLEFRLPEEELDRIIEAKKPKYCGCSLDLADEKKEEEYLDAYETGYQDGYEDGVSDSIGIKNVLVNEKARAITVKFLDGDVRVIKCNEKDEFDYNIGVSLAISEHIFGSKTQRSKFIKNNARFIKIPENKQENRVKVKNTCIKTK